MTTRTLEPELLRKMNAYWRAANYLSVGQIPGQNFIYVHPNRVITKYDLDMLYIAGPGHGGPALVANTYLEGSYTEIYPDISQDGSGLKKLFTQFAFPGGISSHVAPTTPGSIHEGGELGYSLSHAFGAVFDNPGLIVAAPGQCSQRSSRRPPNEAVVYTGRRHTDQHRDRRRGIALAAEVTGG